MREILFRGKSKGNKEWMHGSILNDTVGNAFIAIIRGENKTTILEPVITKTVGQYTGLYDAEGNKVFEGDVLKNAVSSEIGVVEKIKGCWRVECGYRDFSLFDYPVKIIGNIHDNKELI